MRQSLVGVLVALLDELEDEIDLRYLEFRENVEDFLGVDFSLVVGLGVIVVAHGVLDDEIVVQQVFVVGGIFAAARVVVWRRRGERCGRFREFFAFHVRCYVFS